MQPAPTLSAKPHYPILDGLRGVAALLVVAFHLFEAHATSHQDQLINHGYLAVDFFFLLSGFVIGYAYDDRWPKMTLGNFFQRRLVRLQPMVVMGMVVGALLYYFQATPVLPLAGHAPVWQVLVLVLLGSLLVPVPPTFDVRGWQETYPLNGPGWSLMFEYIANVLYAVLVRRFSKLALGVLVALSAAALLHLLLTRPEGDIVGGWSLEPLQLRIGFTRVMFPFFAGLLLFRTMRPGRVAHALLLSSLLVVAVLAMPRLGGLGRPWVNGLYESLSIMLVFPLIIYIGTSGELLSGGSRKLCRFLGNISYPLYITHYPLIYIYTAWVLTNQIPVRQGLPVAAATFGAAVALAYACLKWYDEPVRAWLQRKLAAAPTPPSPQPAGVAAP